MVNNVESVAEFEKLLREPGVKVFHFSADFVEQCKYVNDCLKELSEEEEIKKANVKFYQIAAEDLSEISLKYGIIAAPTLLYFVDGKQSDRVDGVNLKLLREKVYELKGSSCVAGDSDNKIDKKPLNERLKELINRHKVMVFMKGSRTQPRCGFSKQLMEILNSTGVDFDTFDILQDEEVRQGLKTYSDWPTYPQLYVNGQLIGGLDIVKELQASNELLSTLNG